MTVPRIGSMCTGYAGLDMAVQAVLGGEVAWFAENDPDASRVLAHHWPSVPNLGDLTAVDWSAVEPVDVVCGGYPCQPFSDAGKRRGVEDERHIWPYVADAVRVLRPRVAVFENVAGHLRLGFDTVLADLAALGFDARWQVVRASDVGASHRRARLFVLAWQAVRNADSLDRQGWSSVGQPRETRSAPGPATDTAHLGYERSRSARHGRPGPTNGRGAATDAQGARWEGPRPEPARCGPERSGDPATDAQGDGRHEGRPQPARLVGGPDAALSRATPADAYGDGLPRLQERDRDTEAGLKTPRRDDPDRRVLDWGPYGPAIRRWEHATGRAAPSPTEPGRTGPRLSPAFVEWLMGLPAGHVTGVPGISRNAMLRILGNGVVPQQAATALATLLAETASARQGSV